VTDGRSRRKDSGSKKDRQRRSRWKGECRRRMEVVAMETKMMGEDEIKRGNDGVRIR
jgi:hypothetical protein